MNVSLLTPAYFDRTVEILRSTAQENGQIHWFTGKFQYRGSEAAVLRLAKAYEGSEHVAHGDTGAGNLFFFTLWLHDWEGPEMILEPDEGFQVRTFAPLTHHA